MKSMLTREEIISTNDWYLSNYTNSFAEYFWKHKTIVNDGYTFSLTRYDYDGHTKIMETGKEDIILFNGYIESLDELNFLIKLCILRENEI